MVSVSTTFSLPFEIWLKCNEYRLNRSKIAREAIAEYIKKYEEKHGIVDDGEL